MPKFSLRERLIDPRSPTHRPRRAAYALPTLFTAGNIFLGFIAIVQSVEGSLLGNSGNLGSNPHFEIAAKAIGAAVVLDGLDGRIARMTNTVSDFGREMDSLADVITFGIAPAVLAYVWGVQFVDPGGFLQDHQSNPVPRNPGRADRKYFVGLPIPAAAGMVAAVVFAADSEPLTQWMWSASWLALLGILAFLMVCTWRYPSFKQVNLSGPRSPLILILFGALIYLLWNFAQPMLLALSIVYVGSGIILRIASVLKRFRHSPPTPEEQVG
jgi:CDP-diacylglycerol--serine O-phosphatidyltransferase